MDDVRRMKKIDTTEQIVKNNQNVVVVETPRPGSCEDLFQVMIYVIDDQKYLIECLKWFNSYTIFVWYYYVMQFSGENIVSHLWELSQNLDFSQHLFALIEVVKNIANQFYSIGLSGLQIYCTHDLTEATFAE